MSWSVLATGTKTAAFKYARTHTHTHPQTFMHLCICASVRLCLPVCQSASLQDLVIQQKTHTIIFIGLLFYVWRYICIYMYACVCVSTASNGFIYCLLFIIYFMCMRNNLSHFIFAKERQKLCAEVDAYVWVFVCTRAPPFWLKAKQNKKAGFHRKPVKHYIT